MGLRTLLSRLSSTFPLAPAITGRESRHHGYAEIETIDLDELHEDTRRKPSVDLAAHEYDLRQSWLTSLMNMIRSMDYLEPSELPGTSKDALYYTHLSHLARQQQFLQLVLHRDILLLLILSAILELVACVSTVVGPLILRQVLQNPSNGLLLVALLLVGTLATLAGRSKDHFCRLLAVRVSSILQLALFQKCLRLSSAADCPVGRMISCSTTDVMLLRNYIVKVHDIWSSPLQLLLIVILLVNLLGWAGLAGFIAMVALIISQTKANSTVGASMEEYLRLDESRITTLGQSFQRIRGIKALVLESIVVRAVSQIRNTQLIALGRRLRLVFCFFISINQMIPGLSSMVSFIAFLASGHPLIAELAFPALALFELSHGPASKLSLAVTRQFSILPCVYRLRGILSQEEQESEVLCKGQVKHVTGDSITLSGACFSYPQTSERTTSGTEPFGLGPLTVSVPQNSLTIFYGPSGSGKSTLIHGLLGQCLVLPAESVALHGSLALCSQEPWIMSGTVRENILFCQPFDAVRYRQVLHGCCLEADLATFPGGDQALVGENGATLSGGQKARISLARAVYSQADILLLDDPLAAVDVKIARALWHDCIRKLPQTVLMVTHQAELIPFSDHVIMLENGQIVEHGPTRNLLRNSNGKVATLVNAHKGDPGALLDSQLTSDVTSTPKSAPNSTQIIALQEDRPRGGVSWKRYKFYFYYAGGLKFMLLLGGVFLCTIGIRAVSNLWLAWWMRDWRSGPQKEYMLGYIFLMLLQATLVACVGIFLVVGSIQASHRIHEGVIARLFNAPVDFFDSQPLGRVLNRLSVDIEGIDFRLINAGDGLVLAAASLAASTIVLLLSSAYLIFALVPIAYLTWRIQSVYRVSAREVRRVCSLLDSPVLAAVTEAMSARPSIRAYEAIDLFETRYQAPLTRAIAGISVRYALETWVTMRVELVSILLLAGTCLVAGLGLLTPVQAGLALSLTVSLPKQLDTSLWSLINLEVEMNSVERLYYYLTGIPQEEGPTDMSGSIPFSPTVGEIRFLQVTVTYPRSSRASLREFSLHIPGGAKVGIKGRSGSGKSTIVAALVGLAPITTGQVTIDGVDLATLPLSVRRRSLHVLAQDPVLFTGTLRENLDPHGKAEETAMLDALDAVGWWESLATSRTGDAAAAGQSMRSPGRGDSAPFAEARRSPMDLEHSIVSGGANLSAGQAQLVCLARAVLARPKILIMDEATANVDLETEKRIQLTLQRCFPQSTILCVAHRATSVAWMDNVVEMADGKKVG